MSLGLQLLSAPVEPPNRIEIVGDLTEACSTAVTILNDLLLYDKIEEGNLVLEKKPVFVKQFLLKSLGIFSVQVISDSAQCP